MVLHWEHIPLMTLRNTFTCANNASFYLTKGVQVVGSHDYEKEDLILCAIKIFAPSLELLIPKLVKTLVRLDNFNSTAQHKAPDMEQ